jgi:hypothetical protein
MDSLIKAIKEETLSSIFTKHNVIIDNINRILFSIAKKGETKMTFDCREYNEEVKKNIIDYYRIKEFIVEYDYTQNEIAIKW